MLRSCAFVGASSLAVVALFALPVLAADSAAVDDAGFSGKFELGYLATSGNSETSSLNTRLDLTWEGERWRHSLNLAAVQAEDAGVTTAERNQLGAKSDYKFNESDYLFFTVNWEQDRLAGIKQRTSEAVGYGRRIFNTERHKLDAAVGVGARQDTPVTGPSVNETILRGQAKYRWRFAEGAEFNQSLTVEAGSANTFSESVSALTAKLVGSLALKFSYTVKTNSEVAAGLEHTDTYTAVGVEYAF